jgi:hypothetical protein
VILLRARCGEEKRQENRRERGRVESSTHRRVTRELAVASKSTRK